MSRISQGIIRLKGAHARRQLNKVQVTKGSEKLLSKSPQSASKAE